ncbi:dephospho-CoA kinase [Prevotella sp. E13-17]|uniref:dephospho-CoA kinase n=1 Tax=Prevotella sp. E13-17 TaxID=2913616 RepID=UPI001EDC83F7|nr:dephospho-CoA kinase [Prevotella sp. E13-17]UKK50247.1 dephospho-CoA kinase [Prevotella sp. E13-17]
MRIGITGGIGSGKSFVCQLLKQRGIEVYDCDSAAKRLMHTSAQLRQQLSALIGPDTYLQDGRLNKAAVAQFLLTSEENAKAIDNIVHPAVFDDYEKSGIDWVESAILYESGLDRLLDKVIVVTAPEDVRIKRVMQRDHISEAKAKEWITRQLPQEIVRSKADYEIINDGETPLEPQIDNLFK